MSNEETNKSKNKLLLVIKEFKVPWKEFLSPNLLFLIVWIAFLLYSFIWSPEDQAGFGFSNFALADVGPISWSLFNIIGGISLMYVAILFLESRERFIPAWPFVLAAMGLGMYVLMPYFALRGVWKKKPKTKTTWFTKIIDSRTFGIIIHELILSLLLYGIIAGSLNGDWSNYATLFMESNFIHVMTIDFALLCLFYPIIIWDDMKRRNWKSIGLFIFFCIPLFGAIIYLISRPRLEEEEVKTIT